MQPIGGRRLVTYLNVSEQMGLVVKMNSLTREKITYNACNTALVMRTYTYVSCKAASAIF